jgi:assimilatory nitrate reductase catalytic subunit
VKSVRTTCAYCGVGCGITAQVTGERAVTIKGDADHPANFGRLCSKGTHLGETVSLEGRLLYPEIGGERVEWDEAFC